MEGYIIYILLGYIIFRDLMNDSRMNRLLDRVMAKNYEEYQYYSKKYDRDLKEVTKLRDEAREERIEEIETVGNDSETREAQRVLDGFDDEWGIEEVDKTKVMDLIK